jgi:hypothetical protein
MSDECEEQGTPGVVLIITRSGAEAREIFDRIAGCPTYLGAGDGMYPVYRDHESDWFTEVGFTATVAEFMRRFVHRRDT